uniref:Anillin homology domain-containing protein n=1 Tax=Lepeophtheirus salmonis TaxID=72036 RepID=A0A0K2V723_LEPSM
MLLRGLKRKYDCGDEENESEYYRSSLRHFQNASRRRESLRIKTRNEVGGELSVCLELEKRLSIENSLIQGVEKFVKEPTHGLVACLEAAKTLKTSELRRDMLKYELNKLKRGQGRLPPCISSSSLAGLSLSHIRVPLSLPERARVKKSGSYAVFCLARIGSQIYDTALLYPIEPGSTADVSFDDDLIFFSRVPHYFELLIEVYSYLVPSNHTSLPQLETPRKIARSISRVMGKSILKRGIFGGNESNVPKFDLTATANLTLEDCSNEICTYELYVEDLNRTTSTESLNNISSSRALPLFGSMCCHLAARPYCCEEEVYSGEMTLMHQKRASSSSTAKKVWGSLMNWKLSLWNDKNSKGLGKQSLVDIPVSKDTTITDKKGNLQIRNEQVLWEFKFEHDSVMLSQWFQQLSQHGSNHRKWKHAADMKVVSPGSEELPTRSFKRTRSKLVLFYNDV